MLVFTLFLPILYTILGVLFAKNKAINTTKIQNIISLFLSKFLIPFIIFYNVVYYKNGTVYISIATFFIMIILYFLAKTLSKISIFKKLFVHKTDYLSFFYLNIGWFALPITIYLFGEVAGVVVLSAYVASSMLGNIISPAILKGVRLNLYHIVKFPATIAIALGLVCYFFSSYFVFLKSFYFISKHLLSFLGMFLLGLWISKEKLYFKDVKINLYYSFVRSVCVFVVIFCFVQLAIFYNISLVKNNLLAIYLLALLPPAGNIIILESHYLKTGYSAKKIAHGTIISFIFILIYATILSFL